MMSQYDKNQSQYYEELQKYVEEKHEYMRKLLDNFDESVN